MRSKQLLQRFVMFLALGLFASLGVVVTSLAGCGGGNTSQEITTTVTSVTVSPTTGTCTAGGSLSAFTATVNGANNPSQVVKWSVSPASAGTITAAGVFTCSSTITAITTATITAASTVPGYTNITGSATVTINPVPLPTVTITATPSTITVGGSTTIAWSSTNTTSCKASGAWSGTQAVNGSVNETPTATASYTLGCTGAGGNVTASATVTVNPVPLPNATSVSPNTIYADWGNLAIVGASLIGSDFVSTDTVYPTGFDNLYSASYVSPTDMTLEIDLTAGYYSPGWNTYAVCKNSNDTNCGTSATTAILGAQNYLATSSGGELFFLNQAQPNTLQGSALIYKEDGSLANSCTVGMAKHSIAIDDKTSYLLVDGQVYNPNEPNFGDGSCDFYDVPVIPQKIPDLSITAVAADNGYAGLVQSAKDTVWFYDMTGGTASQPTAYSASVPSLPWVMVMGTPASITYGYPVTANGKPSIYKVQASNGVVQGKALPLSGITPATAVTAANLVAGGLYAAILNSGSASGTVAVLSTYDQLLVLVNTNAWTVTKSVKLSGTPGTPFRVTADPTHSAFIVAFANPASVTTTYVSVDAVSGAITPLTTTSSLLSVGLAVSSDGTTLYSSQRNQLEIKQN